MSRVIQRLRALLTITLAMVGGMVGGAILLAPSVARAQPLQTDPGLLTGTLDNGLSYIVMRHATPPGRAGLYLHISSGSLNETDEQRGAAHYLEHMAFNGSENFPPGTLVPFFEGLGLTFGRHQNAFTNFEQTTYQLSLPDNEPDTLAKGLSFFSDVLFRLLILEDEVENERGIILNEKTARKGAQQRIADAMLERTAPGSRYAARSPIGTEETLRAMTRDHLLDYYRRWYTPSNATIIVVADMDPGVVVTAIVEAFDTPGVDATPRPIDEDPGVRPFESTFAVVVTDPELPRATISMTRVEPLRDPITTREALRDNWVESLAMGAFNTRLRNRVSEGTASYRGGFAGVAQSGRILRSVLVSANGAPERWRDMLHELLAEVQRARLHGFSPREIELARRDVIAGFERRATQEETVHASAHLARINARLVSGDTILSGRQMLDLSREILPTITADECAAWFARTYEPERAMFSLQINENTSPPSEPELLAAALEAIRQAPPPLPAADDSPDLLDQLPAPGEVVESSEHAPTGVWSAWLSNNVRLHHRYMEERRGQVNVQITLFGGELHETEATRGVTNAAGLAIGGGGTGAGGGGLPATRRLSSTQIRELMTGRKVNVRGRVGPDAIQVSVAGDPDDLEHAMQLAYLLLTEPRVEEPALDRWREMMLQFVDTRERNPMQVFARLETESRYPDSEPRVRAFTREQIERVTIDAAQATIDRLMRESPIEVAIVGEVSRERAIELALQYLGSLPARPRVTPGRFADLRRIERPALPRVERATVESVTRTAGASVGFYAPDAVQVDDVHAMQLAGAILSTRMIRDLREQQRLVYGIRCGVSPGNAYPGFGMVRAGAPCEPQNAEPLARAITAMYHEFSAKGPTPDEVGVAQRQIANTYSESMKDPNFWLARLEAATADGIPLDEIVRAPDAVRALTPERVREVFNRYYAPDKLITVIVTPVEPAAPQAAPQAGAPAAQPATP